MVADASPATKRRQRSIPVGSGVAIPILVKARVRNLYLGHLLSPKEIAAQINLPVRQVQNLVFNQGWTKLRESKTKQIEARTLARIEKDTQQLVDAVAGESEELALGTLRASHNVLADVGTDPDAPRNLQALSQSAKNFVGIFRQARGLDAKQVGEGGTSQINVMFVGQLPRSAERTTERNVTPQAPVEVQAVSTTPDAQSTIC